MILENAYCLKCLVNCRTLCLHYLHLYERRYTDVEVASAIDALRATTACIRGCYAALRATIRTNPLGRALTAALMNLGWATALTATLWSLRQFRPIRKCGPRVVRLVRNLRPINISTDMTAVQDQLWLGR